MLRLSKKFNKQAGISLLEVMLSLSIIAIILVMATRYFFVASNNSNVNKLRGQIGTLVSALQEYRNQNADFSGLTTGGMNYLVTNGFVAKTGDVSAAPPYKMTDPWGTEITVAPASGNTGAANIVATLPATPEGGAACKAVIAGYASANGTCTGGSSNVLTVIVGTTS